MASPAHGHRVWVNCVELVMEAWCYASWGQQEPETNAEFELFFPQLLGPGLSPSFLDHHLLHLDCWAR